MKSKYKKILGLIIVISLLSAFLILGFSGIDLTGLMIKANNWFYQQIGEIGIYIGTFLISIFGNITVIMPVPYGLSIISVLLTLPVNPLILSVFAALGATLGEISAWLFGKGTASLLKKKQYDDKIKGLKTLINKGYGSWLVFIFALTPLPDDILLIALGISNYPIKKILLASFTGKLMQVISLVFAVFIAKNTLIGQGILYLFGLDLTNGGVKSTGNTLLTTITILITIILTMLIITIDWNKIFWKRLKKKKT